MGEFNSDDHYIYYCGQESLRRNGVAIIVNKSPKCSTWMQTEKKTKSSLFVSKVNRSISHNPTLCPEIQKKLKLNGSMKTYKTF